MPIYDYACSACGRVTEVIHRIHDHGPRFCPECGADGTMRKALSTPTIVFKGSGWAKLDRRSSSGSRSGSRTKPASDAKTDAPAPSAPTGSGSGAGAAGSAGDGGGD